MRRLAAFVTLVVAACARSAAVGPPHAPTPPAPTSSPPSPASNPAPNESTPFANIDPSELRKDLFIFASDSFRGREATTPAAVKGARFIADRLTALGVEPAGDSGFFQRVPMTRQGLGPGTDFSITTPAGTTRLVVGESLVPLLSLGQGAPLPKLNADGEIVFAGYGMSFPELKRDDLAGLDLAGKVVVFVNGAPTGLDSAKRIQLESPNAIGARIGMIAQRNPAAIIALLTGKAREQFPQLAAELRGGSVTLGEAEATDAPRPLPMILLAAPTEGSLLLPVDWPQDDRPRLLRGRRLKGTVDVGNNQFAGYNVVGVVRGGDATLNRSYVAYGAHLDHIGILTPVNGDSIANGADDDGSGSMALLAIAKVMASAPLKPRRSALFVWHTGEEKGLLGSEYFTANPTVPLDSVVAQLNADMIGRNAPDSLFVVGPAAAPNGQSRVLGAVIDSVNARLARPFKFNREWDSPSHAEQIYFRSDHYSYAKRGIPIVFFTTGLHDDYHKVSDEASKIDYEKLARVTQLMYQAGVAVANGATRPRVAQAP